MYLIAVLSLGTVPYNKHHVWCISMSDASKIITVYVLCAGFPIFARCCCFVTTGGNSLGIGPINYYVLYEYICCAYQIHTWHIPQYVPIPTQDTKYFTTIFQLHSRTNLLLLTRGSPPTSISVLDVMLGQRPHDTQQHIQYLEPTWCTEP